MYIIGGCLQQLIYIACRRKTYMDGNPKLTHRPVSMFDIAAIKHKKQDDFAYLSSFPIDRTYIKISTNVPFRHSTQLHHRAKSTLFFATVA